MPSNLFFRPLDSGAHVFGIELTLPINTPIRIDVVTASIGDGCQEDADHTNNDAQQQTKCRMSFEYRHGFYVHRQRVVTICSVDCQPSEHPATNSVFVYPKDMGVTNRFAPRHRLYSKYAKLFSECRVAIKTKP